jgi:TPR repeat protein
LKALDNLKLYYAGCRDTFSKAECYETGRYIKHNFNEALELYQQAMREDDPRAYFRIAQWQEKSGELSTALSTYYLGALKNHQPCSVALQEWAEKEVAEKNLAAFLVGKLWKKKQDWQQAVGWYQKAAENGHVEAMFQTALCYQNANHPEKAKEWFEQAANNNHADSLFQLGQYYLTKPREIDKALNYYKEAAVQGSKYALHALADMSTTNGAACYLLAEMYEQGEGGLQDNLEKSIKFYVQAGELKWSQANFRLGQLYENGEKGLAKDQSTSYGYYALAACQGDLKAKTHLIQLAAAENAEAQYALGYKYYRPQGEFSEAIKWCIKADINDSSAVLPYLRQCANNEEICLQIIKYYKEEYYKEDGHDLFSNKNRCAKRIIEFYTQAIVFGSKEANFCLAQFYENKLRRLKADQEHAYRYYAIAARENHPEARDYLIKLALSNDAEAQYALGFHYYHQIKNLSEAITWCVKAEIQQHQQAAAYLTQTLGNADNYTYLQIAKCYEEDKINPSRSIQRAIEFYGKSSNLGSNTASAWLAQLYENSDSSLERDQKKSYTYYALAAYQGDPNAKNHLIELALSGNVEAQYMLGYHYYCQINDLKEAINWCVKAEMQQHPQAADYLTTTSFNADAYLQIAKCYEDDTTNSGRSTLRAVEFYGRSSELGSASASFKLAHWYENGYESLQPDQEKSYRYYALAAYQGDFNAKNHLLQLAATENSEAQYALGYHYYQQSNKLGEAIKWGVKAEIHQHPQAAQYLTQITLNAESYFNIAKTYYETDIINPERSIARAIEFYTKSSELGFSPASYRLGQLYENLSSESQAELIQACEYYALAIRQNHPDAKKALKRLASNENPEAQYLLANHFNQEKNKPHKALEWFIKADLNQHPEATKHLNERKFDAETYLRMAQQYEIDKTHLRENIPKAVGFYEKAFKLRNNKAAFALGHFFQLDHPGIKNNPERAFDYYLEAAKLGHHEVFPVLDRLGEEMNTERQKKLSLMYSSFNNSYKAAYWQNKAAEVASFQLKY